MSVLANINAILDELRIPVETGVFSGVPPDEYAVLTPLADSYVQFADNKPLMDLSEVRISLFSNGSYTATKNKIIKALLSADFTITDRRYIGFDSDNNYHHYCIDCNQIQDLRED